MAEKMEQDDEIVELTDMIDDADDEDIIELTEIESEGHDLSIEDQEGLEEEIQVSQVSSDQLEAALERVIEKKFSKQIETRLLEVVERVIKKEIAEIRESLQKDLDQIETT